MNFFLFHQQPNDPHATVYYDFLLIFRAIHQVFFTFPSLYLYIFVLIQTQCHKHTRFCHLNACSPLRLEMKREKNQFIKQYILAFCFKTGPKITVEACGYQGLILTTELRNLNWRSPAHTWTLFLLPTESPHVYQQL